MLERRSRRTWNAIAEGLDDDGIDTAREARYWQVGSVQSVFKSKRGRAFILQLDAAEARVDGVMPTELAS